MGERRGVGRLRPPAGQVEQPNPAVDRDHGAGLSAAELTDRPDPARGRRDGVHESLPVSWGVVRMNHAAGTMPRPRMERTRATFAADCHTSGEADTLSPTMNLLRFVVRPSDVATVAGAALLAEDISCHTACERPVYVDTRHSATRAILEKFLGQ